MASIQFEDIAVSDALAAVALRASKVRRLNDTEDEDPNRALPARVLMEDAQQYGSADSWETNASDVDQDLEIEGDSDDEEISDQEISDQEISDEEFGDDDFSDDECTELCEESLNQIEGNDPSFTSLSLCDFSDIDVKEAERCLGRNTSLKKLHINGNLIEWKDSPRKLECFGGLCMGLERNSSIELLSLTECTVPGGLSLMSKLAPCLKNNANLRMLDITSCAIGDQGTQLLASALLASSNKHLLERVSLDANEIGDQPGKELIEALRGYGNIEELSLGDNELGQRSCAALGDFLLNSTLKKLNLENNCIGDVGIHELTVALSSDAVLEELNLSLNGAITQAGWQLFSRCLRQPNSKIKKLDLSSTSLSNEGASALGHSLANNKSLSTLSLLDLNSEGSPLITSAGWQAFLTCLQSKESGLKEIDLRYNSIDEEGLPALASALSCNSSMKVLCLSHNDQITVEGWRSFFTCLRRTNFSIEELHLCGNKISDEVICDLTGVLGLNHSLKRLVLGDFYFSITNRGWSHLSRLLCDKSNLMSIYNSNHSLCHVDHDSVPQDIHSLLSLNEGKNKRDVARRKLLRYHFQDGARNTHDLLELHVKLLPQAISWIGNESDGRALLYEVLRSSPSLFLCGGKLKVSGAKRKR